MSFPPLIWSMFFNFWNGVKRSDVSGSILKLGIPTSLCISVYVWIWDKNICMVLHGSLFHWLIQICTHTHNRQYLIHRVNPEFDLIFLQNRLRRLKRACNTLQSEYSSITHFHFVAIFGRHYQQFLDPTNPFSDGKNLSSFS